MLRVAGGHQGPYTHLSHFVKRACVAMNEERTTAVIQRFLDELQGDAQAAPVIRDLLARAVDRLRHLCGALLHRSYPRLTHPPLNLETDELVGGVVAGLITALQKVHPQTVRQFFALANQHMRWQLNDLARLLDERPRLAAVSESGVVALPDSAESILSQDARRMLLAIEGLPEEDREVFELIRIQGLTHVETAAVVGVSVKTVQRRLNRARLLLAEVLADLTPAGSSQSPGDTPTS
jgi:RNA polymerase sigma factor (sigma-70 family)